MIPHIKSIPPPPQATPYNPAKLVTVPGNGSNKTIIQGRSSQTFGFDRILPGGPDLDNVTVTAILNEDMILFKDIRLSTIRQHFSSMKLLAPYIIQKNNNLELEFKNSTGSDLPVNVQLLGYDTAGLAALIRAYDERGIKMPQPVFLHATETVPANAVSYPVKVPTKSVDLSLLRASVQSGSNENITLSLQIYNETIKNQVFVQQFNDEFESNYPTVPILVDKTVPFTLQATNLDNSAHEVNFLGEAYVQKRGE